jgi:hypothetical protein
MIIKNKKGDSEISDFDDALRHTFGGLGFTRAFER